MTRASHGLAVVLLAALLGACASGGTSLLSPPPLSTEMQGEPDRFVVVTVSNTPRPLATRPGSTPRGYDAAGRYGVTAAAGAAVRALERDYGLSEVSAWPITTLSVHCIVFRVPATTAPATMLARLSKDPRVESAQLLNQFATQEAPAPPAAAAGTREAYNLQASLRALNVVEAHRWSLGTGVRVAVIDTGMDFEHPALKERVLYHQSFVDSDDARFKLDRHGTQIGGLIAAVANNDLGIIGIAPESRLLALKACWQLAGDATRAVCNSFTLAQALEAAILARADVVNLSLSGPPDPLLTRLVRRGQQAGILFVGAVAPRGTGLEFPAAIDGVLAVASAEDTQSADGHYLLAPGREVLTLVPGGHLDFASGSSLAAAEVSGTLALLLAEQHGISAARAHSILATTSAQIVGPSGSSLTSINACAALVAIMQRESCAVEADSGTVLRRRRAAAR
jgi:subtilisin family serine protease